MRFPVNILKFRKYSNNLKFRKYSNNVIKKAKEFDNSMIITILMSPNKHIAPFSHEQK